jgi:hypothetical protein
MHTPQPFWRKWLWRTGLSALVGVNAVAFFHAISGLSVNSTDIIKDC